MDTEASKQERVQVVLVRVREVWPNEAAEEWMHGSNGALDGARPIDLVRLGRIHEGLAALEVARA
ncbi:antitoxin Xre/MbcA/ParS toxin-binding domain-containing protein [Kocuria sp. M4R2S49]|uniref:antitoxin Xre/MbcA/ParS toxin-binding domain-containing protein n=1 Tax=Kocuria rhizosphaericola TaxID=3376284 RepID=UPI0037BD3DBE